MKKRWANIQALTVSFILPNSPFFKSGNLSLNVLAIISFIEYFFLNEFIHFEFKVTGTLFIVLRLRLYHILRMNFFYEFKRFNTKFPEMMRLNFLIL